MAAPKTTVTTLDDTQETAPEVRVQQINGSESHDDFSGERITVTIHAGEGEPGKQAVYLSVNNVNALVPRGIPCSLPIELFKSALENAVMTVYDTQLDGTSIPREVRRYSYTAVQEAPTARAKK